MGYYINVISTGKEPDGRKRTWLVHPKAAILAGYTGK